MGIKLKSQKSGNWVGIAMVYPSGATETVAMVLILDSRKRDDEILVMQF